MFPLEGTVADVVQAAVVGFSHYRIYGPDVLVAGQGQHVVHDGGGGVPYPEGVGQQNGGFKLAEFFHLGLANQFPKAVAHDHRCWDLLLKKIAGVGQDGGGSGADAFALNQGEVAYADPRDICDGIVGSGREHAGGNSQIAGARPVCLLRMNARE